MDLGSSVAVRDSKDPDGPQLTVGSRAWQTFIATVREIEP